MKKDRIIKCAVAVLIAVTVFLLNLFGIKGNLSGLQGVDNFFADPLYQSTAVRNKDIHIVGITTETITEFSEQGYGKYEEWLREKTVELIEKLNEDPDDRPALIVLDILFTAASTNDPELDARFVEACRKGNNVIAGADIIYGTKRVTGADGIPTIIKNAVVGVEYPFEALKEVTSCGFCNANQDSDSYTRRSQLYTGYKGKVVNSLAYETYLRYTALKGIEKKQIKTYDDARFYFMYSGKASKENYEITGMHTVLSGKMSVAQFAGDVVFVGAYAPGMADAYNVAIEKGVQMNGVEIHANIFQALLDGRTAVYPPAALSAVIAGILAALLFLAADKLKLSYALILNAAVIAVWVIICKILSINGIILPIIFVCIPAVLIMAYSVVVKYILERVRRHKTLSAFAKYVAPQIIDRLSNGSGDFEIKLGGERRNIAVLFVDIRGFTTMSESLEPEQVVGILNKYLDLTSRSIFRNE